MKASTPVFSASRRFAVAAPLLFIAAVAAPGLSPAQDFPSRPIRLIVPFPPGDRRTSSPGRWRRCWATRSSRR